MLGCLVTAIISGNSRLRPPSVPLITHDPYFSIWSPADNAYDHESTHWTGRPQPLNALVKVDGTTYRLVGTSEYAPLPQTSLGITPTQTTYTFANDTIEVLVSFASPLLPHDLDVFSRPVSYVTFDASSRDHKAHKVELFFGVSGRVAVNTADQKATASTGETKAVNYAKIGTVEQPVLAKRGDDLRIDWGHAYLASDRKQGWQVEGGELGHNHDLFATGGHLAGMLNLHDRPAAELELSATKDFGSVRHAAAWLMVAYDDEFGLQYFDSALRPFWRRRGATGESILDVATKQHDSVLRACDEFDRKLTRDLREIGGEKYAQVCALAYRQAVAGNKLVADAAGRPLLLPKENFSNGCIGTVDVIYPMAPLFFMLGPDLAKAMLVPVLDYGASKRWKFPFAPHDLGTYPQATGQVYGGGEETEDNQMPVEESGNMILLVAALAEIEGNAKFAEKYWPQLSRWAEYLKQKGLDPANQLCTDDFMGHLAHNANLSVKAILALGAYGKLADRLGHTADAQTYRELAEGYARRWVDLAKEGDHTKLAFDQKGTWSQKYNMVWDDVLGLNLFSKALKKSEVGFYLKSMKTYGLPLDNRSSGMKVDWLCWTATLSRDRDDFEKFIAPMWDFLNETTDRVPICDWVHTDSKKHIGMIARPVLGGAFLPVLQDREVWQKWFKRGVRSEQAWAPIPIANRRVLVDTAKTHPQEWRFTVAQPAATWFHAEFDDSAWAAGKSGFGTPITPGAIIGTRWDGDDIWIRRLAVIPQAARGELRLCVHHDEDAEIYINGELAAKLSGWTTGYVDVPILPGAARAIRFDRPNSIAVHCHQTTGGQFIDVGIVAVEKLK